MFNIEDNLKIFLETKFNIKFSSTELFSEFGKLFRFDHKKESYFCFVYKDSKYFFPNQNEKKIYTDILNKNDYTLKFIESIYWNDFNISILKGKKYLQLEYDINEFNNKVKNIIATDLGELFSEIHNIENKNCISNYIDVCKKPVNSWKEYLNNWYDLLEIQLIAEKAISVHWMEKIRDIIKRKIDIIEEPPCFGLVHGQAILDNILYLKEKDNYKLKIINFSRSFFGDTDYDFIFLNNEFKFHKGIQQNFIKKYTDNIILNYNFKEKLDLYKLMHQLENLYLAVYYNTDEPYRIEEYRDNIGYLIS